MNYKYLLAALLVTPALAKDKSTTYYTETIPVTANGATYTKTVTGIYTGQATTLPTSGTATTTIRVSNSDATYTKTVVVTYGKDEETTTHLTVTEESATYTKTLTTEVSNPDATTDSSSDSSDSSSASSTSSESSSSDGAAAGMKIGTPALALGVAAVFLL